MMIIKMDLKDKLEIFKIKGWTYDPITGDIFNSKGRLCNTISDGYIICNSWYKGRGLRVRGHQLGYYLTTSIIPVEIDHIDGNRSNNILSNLRNTTHQKNIWNKIWKGYSYCKKTGRYSTRIVVDGKRIWLGRQDTIEEAHQVYLDAKKLYHPL